MHLIATQPSRFSLFTNFPKQSTPMPPRSPPTGFFGFGCYTLLSNAKTELHILIVGKLLGWYRNSSVVIFSKLFVHCNIPATCSVTITRVSRYVFGANLKNYEL